MQPVGGWSPEPDSNQWRLPGRKPPIRDRLVPAIIIGVLAAAFIALLIYAYVAS